MDSMRHLSTSLPRTRRKHDQPELLADFRAAALSVTNLYKSAAISQDKARAAGYQDALEDLLLFLDNENLGLMDGEGWRVRQWATERLVDDGLPKPAGSDDGEEPAADEQRSTSPEVQRKASVPPPSSIDAVEDTPTRRTAVSEPPQSKAQTPPPPTHPLLSVAPAMDDFTFRSSHAYPTNHDRESSQYSMELDTSSATPSSTESVRIIPRAARTRLTNHQRQRMNANTTTTINLNLGSGAGSKRRLPYSDFFDISGPTGPDGRDGKGGKRGRYV